LITDKIYDHDEANVGAGRGRADNGLEPREEMEVAMG